MEYVAEDEVDLSDLSDIEVCSFSSFCKRNMSLIFWFLQDFEAGDREQSDESSSEESSSSDEEQPTAKKRKLIKKKRPKIEIEYETEYDQPSTSRAKAVQF